MKILLNNHTELFKSAVKTCIISGMYPCDAIANGIEIVSEKYKGNYIFDDEKLEVNFDLEINEEFVAAYLCGAQNEKIIIDLDNCMWFKRPQGEYVKGENVMEIGCLELGPDNLWWMLEDPDTWEGTRNAVEEAMENYKRETNL